jgi:hypothetical protein
MEIGCLKIRKGHSNLRLDEMAYALTGWRFLDYTGEGFKGGKVLWAHGRAGRE